MLKPLDFRQLIAEAKEEFAAYIAELEGQYRTRERRRRRGRLPVFAFLGHGRAGKDAAADYLSLYTLLVHGGSLSAAVCPLIAHGLGLSPEEAFAQRHTDRNYWYQWCNAYREDDPAALLRLTLGRGDIVVGIRARVELETAINQRVIDIPVWVSRPGIPLDPTLEFSENDLGSLTPYWKLFNSAGLAELEAKTLVLAERCGIAIGVRHDTAIEASHAD